MMTCVPEEEFEKFAHLGIVLNDQDHASAANSFDDAVVHALPMMLKLWVRSRSAEALPRLRRPNLAYPVDARSHKIWCQQTT